jgi:hypothetical protein
MLMDASIKSLSKPGEFHPYRRVTTAELAWGLRMKPEDFLGELPRTPRGGLIDYVILADFDIMHYGGSDSAPDDWMFGG